jgi:hypothetical protein
MEPATFRLVEQFLNQMRRRVPPYQRGRVVKSNLIVAFLRKFQCRQRVVKSNLNGDFFKEIPVSWEGCQI